MRKFFFVSLFFSFLISAQVNGKTYKVKAKTPKGWTSKKSPLEGCRLAQDKGNFTCFINGYGREAQALKRVLIFNFEEDQSYCELKVKCSGSSYEPKTNEIEFKILKGPIIINSEA